MGVYLPLDEPRFFQGEVLAGVEEFTLDPTGIAGGEPLIRVITHPFAVIVSQDCDLAQDFERHAKGEISQLPNVLFSSASPASDARGSFDSTSWKQAKQNNVVRYHCIQAVTVEEDAAGMGIPALVLDFKKYFCVPQDALNELLARGKIQRRARLNVPYAEQLSNRFAHYLSRIALPVDHEIQIEANKPTS